MNNRDQKKMETKGLGDKIKDALTTETSDLLQRLEILERMIYADCSLCDTQMLPIGYHKKRAEKVITFECDACGSVELVTQKTRVVSPRHIVDSHIPFDFVFRESMAQQLDAKQRAEVARSLAIATETPHEDPFNI